VSWKPPKRVLDFDHNKKSDAEFPQEGTHKDVACAKCHPKARFNLKSSKPGNCGNSGCHRSPHGGMLFDKKSCDWCHSPKFRSLRKFEFNHRKRTRFDLSGGHSKLKCYDCHTKKLGFKKPDRGCARCHAKDNPHRDRFSKFGKPPRCETCHPETSWKPNRFQHQRRTGFALAGKHGQVKCRSCHRGRKPYDFEKLTEKTGRGRRCMGCHEHKNVHNGDFTDLPKSKRPKKPNGEPIQTCLECHVEGRTPKAGDKMDVAVHERDGRWPLLRAHKKIKCGKCHVNGEFFDTPRQCGVRCHDDSLHRGRLGDECDACHEPGRWKAVRFDHTDDTEWPLVGLHRTVPECEDCHPNRKYARTPKKCSAVGCHAKDDAHRGRLGKKCEQCHLETGENIFDHNRQSDYKLTGAHLTTPCADCHPSVTFKPRPRDCYGGGACHPEPKVHKGQFGTQCETCHNTTSFADILALHDVGDFQLKGAHDRQPCEKCHINNRRLAGMGNLCISCHRQDDVHGNSMSGRCGECHTQWAFAPARFDHSTVGCNLTGLHRTLPCYDCHKTGTFGGLSARCYACHKDTALTAVDKDAGHATYTGCSECHNPTTWLGGGSAAYGRESICR
jgi:hypothetical protein